MEVLEFGRGLLLVAACVTAAVFLSALLALLLKDRRFVLAARRGLYAVFLLTAGAAGALVYGFLAGEYNNEYIYNYSERGLPAFFKFAGLWAGLDGSLLFWTLLLAGYSAAAAFQHRSSARHPTGRRMEPYVYLALASIIGFFLGVTLNENVFASMDLSQRLGLQARHGVGIDPAGNLLDGHGLNPQLVNYWFVIHPPTLYLGFIGFSVPFAFTLAALFVGEVGDYWIRIVRRWTMVAWVLLTSGVILGGLWAYRQLGWGGYWAWDPVENASFLPWCAATAFLHSIMIQERRDMLKGWNVCLIILTFFLTIVATWMTRSGVVESVHAFAGGGSIGTWFQVFMFITAAVSLFLLAYRLRELRGSHVMESWFSREAAFYFNNWVLLLIAAVVFFYSFGNKISHDWFARPITDHGGYKITYPLFAALLFLTAVGPGLGWVKSSARNLRRNFLGTSVATMALTGLVYLFFWGRGMLGTAKEVLLPRYFHLEDPTPFDLLTAQHPTALYPTGLFIALSLFIFATVFSELFRTLRARMALREQTLVTALLQTVLRNNRRWGGYVVHLGIAVLTLGIVASSMFQVTKEVQAFRVGDAVDVGPYTVRFVDVRRREEPRPGEPYHLDELVFRVTRRAESGLPAAHGEAPQPSAAASAPREEVLVCELRPERRYYPKQDIDINEVSIHRMLLGDIYLYAKRSAQDPNVYGLTAYLNPLMILIYLGWFALVAGAVFAALPIPGSRVGLSE
jgi:cytochrome c-type biogenesis protein CcmF